MKSRTASAPKLLELASHLAGGVRQEEFFGEYFLVNFRGGSFGNISHVTEPSWFTPRIVKACGSRSFTPRPRTTASSPIPPYNESMKSEANPNQHNELENEPHLRLEKELKKVSKEQQRKKEVREKIKAEDLDLFELISLVRNHSRQISQVSRSAERIKKFFRQKFEVEL
jgi:hypothetical protein